MKDFNQNRHISIASCFTDSIISTQRSFCFPFLKNQQFNRLFSVKWFWWWLLNSWYWNYPIAFVTVCNIMFLLSICLKVNLRARCLHHDILVMFKRRARPPVSSNKIVVVNKRTILLLFSLLLTIYRRLPWIPFVGFILIKVSHIVLAVRNVYLRNDRFVSFKYSCSFLHSIVDWKFHYSRQLNRCSLKTWERE